MKKYVLLAALILCSCDVNPRIDSGTWSVSDMGRIPYKNVYIHKVGIISQETSFPHFIYYMETADGEVISPATLNHAVPCGKTTRIETISVVEAPPVDTAYQLYLQLKARYDK